MELVKSLLVTFVINRVGARILALLLLLVSSLGISVLLLHESLSSFESSSLDVFGSLREKFTEFLNHGFLNTHENNVRKNVILQARSSVIWNSFEGLEDDIGLKVVENLVVSEVRVFR